MNSRQKLVVVIASVIIVSALIVWLAGGMEMFSKTQVLVDKTTELDKMLGVKREVWEDKIIFGLLPSGMALTFESFSVASFGGVIVLISGILFFVFRNKKNKETK